MFCFEKKLTTPSIGGDAEELEFSYTARENVGTNTSENGFLANKIYAYYRIQPFSP